MNQRLQSQTPQIVKGSCTNLSPLPGRCAEYNQVRYIDRLDVIDPSAGLDKLLTLIQSFKIGKVPHAYLDLGDVNTRDIGF